MPPSTPLEEPSGPLPRSGIRMGRMHGFLPDTHLPQLPQPRVPARGWPKFDDSQMACLRDTDFRPSPSKQTVCLYLGG